MIKYIYRKHEPKEISVPIFPFLSMFVGGFLLMYILFPILIFELFNSQNTNIISPLSNDIVSQAIASEDQNLINADNWFNNLPHTKNINISSYQLSVPKLGIYKANVKMDSTDLAQSLVHYTDSGVPGKYGNAVIFGHSVLPQFYDSKNYMTIFSLLPNLKENDDVYVHFDGMDYRYQVVGKIIVGPDDITGLEQRYDNSYITLVTCVPPGTYFKRLWITARLTRFGDKKI